MDIRNIGAKAGQSQSRLDQLLEDIYRKNYGTGTDGYRFEKTVCQLASAKGIKNEFMARPGRADLILYLPDGTGHVRRITVELKTGCGIVAELPALKGDSIENYGPHNVYPDADLIVYAARATEFEDIDELLDESIVLPPLAWVDFMIENSGKRKHGFETAFKLGVNSSALRDMNEAIPARPMVDKKGNPVLDEEGNPKMTKRGVPRYTDCIVIQEAYRNQVTEAIQYNIETRQVETLGDWLERIGRA